MAFVFFTQNFSVDTNGVTIKRSDDGADGSIPLDIKMKSLVLFPETSSTSYMYKGNHASSEWNTCEGAYPLPTDSDPGSVICYIKAVSGSFTLNLDVRGS